MDIHGNIICFQRQGENKIPSNSTWTVSFNLGESLLVVLSDSGKENNLLTLKIEWIGSSFNLGRNTDVCVNTKC